MNRKHFIKTFAAMAGGVTLVSCSNDLIGDLVEEAEPLDAISVEDAKNWFESQYLPNLKTGVRLNGNGKSHKRKAAWERAQKPKNAAKKDYVWVPIDYEDNARPGVVIYDENTLFKKELSKYYLQPVIEGLIVVKVKNETRAFLAQVAYDMQAVAANNFIIEKSKFSGTLLKVDWDDNLINGVTYEKGQPVKGFKDANDVNNNNGRVTGCDLTLIASMNTYYVNSSGELVIVVHNTWAGSCDGSGAGTSNGGFGGFGDGNYGGGGAGGTYGGSYYDPYVHSDAGNIQYPPPLAQIYNFNMTKAIQAPGPDRITLNNNAKEALYAVGLAASTLGLTWAKADALAKAVGGNIDEFLPTVTVLGRKFGVIGAAIGTVELLTGTPQLIIGLTDGNISNEDWINIAQAGLGIAGLVTTGWVAVGIGAVSVGIAIATAP
jgi:hypothetical protein